MSNQNRTIKILDIFAYSFLVVNVILVPFLIDKNLQNLYIIPKQYVFSGLILISALFWIAKTIVSRSIEYKNTLLDIPVAIILLSCLASSIFSAGRYDSFFGRGDFFAMNFVFILFLSVFYFLVVNLLDTRARWRGLVDTFLAVGGVSASLFMIKSVLILML